MNSQYFIGDTPPFWRCTTDTINIQVDWLHNDTVIDIGLVFNDTG